MESKHMVRELKFHSNSMREPKRRTAGYGGIECLEARIAPATVTTLADSGAGSLRAAIDAANADPLDNTIDFGTLGGAIKLGSSLPAITEDVTVAPTKGITLDGQGKVQILSILDLDAGDTEGVDVTLRGIHFKNGFDESRGAAIQIDVPGGSVTIGNSVISGNKAAANPSGSDVLGGAVYIAEGSVTIANSTITGNTATSAGGSAKGGGIYNSSGDLIIRGTTLSKNNASGAYGGFGGGLYSGDGSTLIIEDQATIGKNGKATIRQSIFTANLAKGLDGDDAARGANGLAGANGERGQDGEPGEPGEPGEDGLADGGHAGGGGLFFSGTTLEIKNSILSGNKAIAGSGGDGGAGGNGGKGGRGGAGYTEYGYRTPAGHAGPAGDGGSGGSGGNGGAAEGGGILLAGSDQVTISNSIITGNEAASGTGGLGGAGGKGLHAGSQGETGTGGSASGGGLHAFLNEDGNSTLTIQNSEVSKNKVSGYENASGGGILFSGGKLVIEGVAPTDPQLFSSKIIGNTVIGRSGLSGVNGTAGAPGFEPGEDGKPGGGGTEGRSGTVATGGGVATLGGEVEIRDSLISGNSVLGGNGGNGGDGGNGGKGGPSMTDGEPGPAGAKGAGGPGGTPGAGGSADGGGLWIWSQAVTITGSEISKNKVDAGEPGKPGKPGSVVIPDAGISGDEIAGISGVATGGGAWIAGHTIDISKSSILANSATGFDALGGGAILDGSQVTISDSAISSNRIVAGNGTNGTNGGAGTNGAKGVRGSDGSDGDPGFDGGGGGRGGNALGGGLHVALADPGSLATVVRSTLSGNTATGGNGGNGGKGGNGGSGGAGGAGYGAGEYHVPGGLRGYGANGANGGDAGMAGSVGGGGIYASSAQGRIEIDSTTISGNVIGSGKNGKAGAAGSGGGGSEKGENGVGGSTATSIDAAGGGLRIAMHAATGEIRQSTVANNKCAGDGGGVAVFDLADPSGEAPSLLELSNSTIAGNIATLGTGGGLFASTPFVDVAAVDVVSSIIAGNKASAKETASGPGGADVGGSANGVSAIYSLVQTKPLAGGALTQSSLIDVTNHFSLDPLLDALKDNGGPTFTMLPKAGSPVIDNGSNPNGEVYDQRGGDGVGPGEDFERTIPQAQATDIGAVEYRSN